MCPVWPGDMRFGSGRCIRSVHRLTNLRRRLLPLGHHTAAGVGVGGVGVAVVWVTVGGAGVAGEADVGGSMTPSLQLVAIRPLVVVD